MANNWDKIRNISSGVKGLTIIGSTDIIINAMSAFFWFYMAALMGPEDYGYLSYILAIGGIASTISLAGSGNTITVFTAKKVKIESAIYLISLVFLAVTSIVLYFMFNNLELIVWVAGAVIFGLAGAEIIGKKDYNSYAIYAFVQRALMIVFAISFFHMIGKEGIVLGLGLAFFPYIIRLYKSFKQTRIDFPLLKSHSKFYIHTGATNLVTATSSSIDKLIIGALLGFTILGNYQLGIQLLAILEMLPAILLKYTLPHDSNGNPNVKLMFIFSIILTIMGIVLSPIIIPEFFPKFIDTIQVFQILSLSLIPTTLNTSIMSKLIGNEKTRLVLISSIIYIISQVISIVILATIWGINGVAVGYVLSVIVQMIFLLTVKRNILDKMNL
jgi:O-antigen/teichoic acid export membrane protein